MDTSDLQPLIEDLLNNISDLESSLSPLLNTPLSQSTSKLPLLDKAKLYVLATYAIESVLFSSLRLNGVDAKTHPVFQELARVKEYFAKIKLAEFGPEQRTSVLNKEAAGRFVKHGLAGNERYDRERAERGVRERAGAKRKLEEMGTGTHTRFEGVGKRIRAEEERRSGELEGDGEEREGQELTRKRKAPKTSKEALGALGGSEGGDEVMAKTRRKKKHRKAEE